MRCSCWAVGLVLVLSVVAGGVSLTPAVDRPDEVIEGTFFAALSDSNTVVVRWIVVSMDGIESFDVVRSTLPEGPYEAVNESPIAPANPGIFDDKTVEAGTEYWYGVWALLETGAMGHVGGGYVRITTGDTSVERASWGRIKARLAN
jgi:hypothetical protein